MRNEVLPHFSDIIILIRHARAYLILFNLLIECSYFKKSDEALAFLMRTIMSATYGSTLFLISSYILNLAGNCIRVLPAMLAID